jgi:hypothetical protein
MKGWRAAMSFGDWLQMRRVHRMVITVPICTIGCYGVSAVSHMFRLAGESLFSVQFLAAALFWGVFVGAAFAFTLPLARPNPRNWPK